MKTVKKNVNLKPFISKSLDFYFDDSSFAVFDIESTGLNPAYCSVMISGILIANGNKGEFIQYFAEGPDDEEEILKNTIALLSSVNYILTYNGRHFDLPFIKKRAIRYGIDSSDIPYTLDLYLVLNGYSPFKNFLPDLKQKSVEIFMGLASSRDDTISGKENVNLYNLYLENHSPQIMHTLLLHNHDDILQLYKLLPVIKQTDFHKAMFSLGYPLKEYTVKKTFSSGRDIKVLGEQNNNPVDYISFPTEEHPFTLTMSKNDKSFELTIPCFNESGYLVSDIYQILGQRAEQLSEYPDVVNGYLITSTPEGLNHFEINAFVKIMLNEIIPEIFN